MLLILRLILCVHYTTSVTVRQTPDALSILPDQKVVVNCIVDGGSSSNYMYWYRQYPGAGPQMLFYSVGEGNVQPDNSVDGLKAERPKPNEFYLTSSRLEANSSAVYFCAWSTQRLGETRVTHKNLTHPSIYSERPPLAVRSLCCSPRHSEIFYVSVSMTGRNACFILKDDTSVTDHQTLEALAGSPGQKVGWCTIEDGNSNHVMYYWYRQYRVKGGDNLFFSYVADNVQPETPVQPESFHLPNKVTRIMDRTHPLPLF
ncbi:uncharacterized protein LOC129715124 [Leucoraja erinacea]|uniref:uncharacterized protein LOC129715124 n=1 Tax=Leucoraja erinaceus TaxID=7782 RepID=UPI002456973A|nr:uncharacterized protein LOC129715124 [Leucoraja erinacea]